MDESLSLETPEQIEIHYRIARLGSRFIATLWDTMAIVAIQIMLVIAANYASGLLEPFGPTVGNWAVAGFILLGFLLYWGYYVLFELLWNGQTPGKRLVGIRTVRQSGYPIGFAESAIRNLVRIADLLPGIYGIGVLVMFLDSRSRRLGDFAAGTLVVHDRPPLPLAALSPRATLDERLLEPPLPHLERLLPAEIEATRRFLLRREELTTADSLAAQLAGRFRARLELAPPDGSAAAEDVALLRRIVAQYGR